MCSSCPVPKKDLLLLLMLLLLLLLPLKTTQSYGPA
jgi:hypothetical protein